MLEYWLKRHAGRSNTWIAKDVGVGRHTVERKREQMETNKAIGLVEKLEGEDGRLRPRHAAPRSPKPGLPDTSPLTFPAPKLERQEQIFSA